MQNNPQKEMMLQLNLQERPLQKSMMQLPTHYSPRSPQSRPSAIDIPSLTNLKKSGISSKQSATSASTITTNSHASFNFSRVNQGYQPIFTRQNKKTTSPALKGLLSPIKSETRYQSNPEDSTRYTPKTDRVLFSNSQSKPTAFQQQQVIQEIVNQVKERHLPQLLGKLKKEVYDDIYNLRLEFQAFKEQARLAIKKQEGSLLEMKFLQNTNEPQVKKTAVHQTKSLGSNNNEDYADLQTNFFLLEGKLNQIQTRISEHFKLNCDQFDNLKAKLLQNEQKHSISCAPIKSSLPPILLEYRQSFIVKKQGIPHECIINHATYHIDKQGYLLDQDNHYLLDRRGYQIKLQDKHFKLLQSHHLINY